MQWLKNAFYLVQCFLQIATKMLLDFIELRGMLHLEISLAPYVPTKLRDKLHSVTTPLRHVTTVLQRDLDHANW